jgi:hypothetical protein
MCKTAPGVFCIYTCSPVEYVCLLGKQYNPSLVDSSCYAVLSLNYTGWSLELK